MRRRKDHPQLRTGAEGTLQAIGGESAGHRLRGRVQVALGRRIGEFGGLGPFEPQHLAAGPMLALHRPQVVGRAEGSAHC